MLKAVDVMRCCGEGTFRRWLVRAMASLAPAKGALRNLLMNLNIIRTEIPEVMIIEPTVFRDARGFFFESFNRKVFSAAVGLDIDFVQDNHSKGSRGVLRGLHYQIEQPQGKLVRVVNGAVFDVAVDLREKSCTFGNWVGIELTAENRRQLWIPPGFAHGFLVLSASADLLYKATDYYAPQYERCIAWNDPSIDIRWPNCGSIPFLSEKDKKGIDFLMAEIYR